MKLAKLNRERYAKLLSDEVINQQQFDQAQTTFDTAIATLEAREVAVNAVHEQVSVAQGGLTQAKTTGFNPSIRNAQLEALMRKREQSYAQLKSAWAKVKSAQAKAKEALASQLPEEPPQHAAAPPPLKSQSRQHLSLLRESSLTYKRE